MPNWCANELRVYGNDSCLLAARKAFEAACEDSAETTVVEYGPFATKWKSKSQGGMQQASVWRHQISGPRPRIAPLRLPETLCVQCGKVATNHRECPLCHENFYCDKDLHVKHCGNAHRESCLKVPEGPLDQYESELVVSCKAKWSPPWEEPELKTMSARYPKALFQLRFAARGQGFVGTFQAQAGKLTVAYERKTTAGEINIVRRRGGREGERVVTYAGPYADLLRRSE